VNERWKAVAVRTQAGRVNATHLGPQLGEPGHHVRGVRLNRQPADRAHTGPILPQVFQRQNHVSAGGQRFRHVAR